MKPSFENAKQGDKVWSFEFGWGEVIGKYPNTLFVKFSHSQYEYRYDVYGIRKTHSKSAKHNRTLFWCDLECEPVAEKTHEGKTMYRVSLNAEFWQDIDIELTDEEYEAYKKMSLLEQESFLKDKEVLDKADSDLVTIEIVNVAKIKK